MAYRFSNHGQLASVLVLARGLDLLTSLYASQRLPLPLRGVLRLATDIAGSHDGQLAPYRNIDARMIRTCYNCLYRLVGTCFCLGGVALARKDVDPKDVDPKDVDPAALLIAVFVVVSGEVSSPGLWDFFDMTIALVVLVIVLAYSFPAAYQQRRFQRVALSLVIGVVLAVAISWPLQWLIVIPFCKAASEEVTADRATIIGLTFALPVAFSFVFRLCARRRRMWMLTCLTVRRLMGWIRPSPSDL